MRRPFHRRDFLKLSGLVSLGLAAPRFLREAALSQAGGNQNVLVIVFDALSALNISFYGYGRKTTPNLTRLAERAVVYHNHFAGGNFTTAGTATLLTGTLPWTHRAIEPGARVADSVESHNLFNAFPGYYRTAYTHNGWANILLKQFAGYMEELVPREKLFLESYDGFIHSLFYGDDDLATLSWARTMEGTDGYSYSLFLSHLYRALRERGIANLKTRYPRGIPSAFSSDTSGFLLEQAVAWIGSRLTVLPQPFLGYFHFLPPHAPYRTSVEFYGTFAKDGLKPVEKPIDVFATEAPTGELLSARTEYDEYILYADQAFGDLFRSIEGSGLLENTWVIFTSDHGEMFERGMIGHGNSTLYQPLIRVPLLIFEPGRSVGANVQAPTSAIDVLPTLLHLTGHAIPAWVEGSVLPPYATPGPDPDRSIYAMQAKKSPQDAPLVTASTTLVKGRYKLIYCFGYPKIPRGEVIQLFDIQSDPEELVNLHDVQPEVAQKLLDELKAMLADVNRPYL